jgi:Raf kinase inhibitor-like YbhB/YbcL family protein
MEFDMSNFLHVFTRFLAIGLLVLASSLVFADQLSLASASIQDGKIERAHACRQQGGKDLSLQLSIKNIPKEAKFLAVVSDDPDAVRPAGRVWVHWNLFNIPKKSDELEIAAGEKIDGDAGRTTGGYKGYEGMCPPDGVHTYRFAVFALGEKIELGGFFGPSAMTIDSFESKYKQLVLAKAVISGKF